MKSRSGFRPSVIGKIAVATVLLVLAACESKSSTTTAVEVTTSTSTSTTTTTIPNERAVGDLGPGGGIVIYTSETPFKCGPDLESKCDAIESAPPKWWKSVSLPRECDGESSQTDPVCRWDNGSYNFSGKTFLEDVGGGAVNTRFMLAAGSPTAKAATAYRGGGFTDWYVPSKTELLMECWRAHDVFESSNNKDCPGFLNDTYENDDYFSSTTSGSDYVSGIWMGAGRVQRMPRTTKGMMRPVRAFLLADAENSTSTTVAATTTTKPKATTTTTTIGVKCGEGGVTCKVGDTTVNGGKVFYVSSAGFSCGATMSDTCHYLEVADASWRLSAQSPCVTSGNYSVLCTWGASSDAYVVNDSHIGGGLKSSNAVSAAYGNTGGYAAMQAMSYSGGGKSDWYLPNLDELRELCKYANGQVTGTDAKCTSGTLRSDFVSEAYWSSTDSGLSKVNVINFGDPVGGASIAKNGTAQTRPIRAF